MSQQRYSSVPHTDGTELAPLDETWKAPNATVTRYPSYPSISDNGFAQTPPTPYAPHDSYAPTPPTQYAPYAGGADPMTEPLKPDHHRLHHWESPKPPVIKTILVQFFAFLWLVPIAGLLYFNISEYVIGASAWCPFGNCVPDLYRDEEKAVRQPAEFDKDSHNLLGSLQLVAKALEVWFILICGWFVYLVTAILASRRGGLPIGYFFRSVEFAELASVVDPLLWTSLGRRRKLWIYIVGTVFLCLLCNLMGPAVAVLVIPSLQWIKTPNVGHVTMTHLNYDNVLNNSGFAFQNSGCDTGDPDNQPYFEGKFSCSTSGAQATDAGFLAQQNVKNVFSSQDLLTFSYNTTEPTETQPMVNWIPSRQIISNMSVDYLLIVQFSNGTSLAEVPSDVVEALGGQDIFEEQYNAYVRMTHSVQNFLQRDGPILGSVVNYWLSTDGDKQWETTVDSSRAIRCYEGWNISNSFQDWGYSEAVGTYTRCIEIGTGWDGYKSGSFEVDGIWLEKDTFSPEIPITIHQSGRVAFLPDGNLPAGFPASCLPKGGPIATTNSTSTGSCNWDTFFESGQNNPLLRTRSRNVTTWDMTWSPEETAGHPSLISMAVDFSVYQTMAKHSIDTSWITNPLFIANFLLKDDSTALPLDQPLPIDPAWTLASFAVNSGGKVDPSRRDAGGRLLDLFNKVWNNPEDPQPMYTYQDLVDGSMGMPIIQMLSMIDHSTAVSRDVTEKNQDPAHPLLLLNSRTYVWAYGLASRTSYVGVAVAMLGSAVVILEILLGFIDRRRFRSPTQLLVAALEHTPNDEFKGVREEKLISRMPFRLLNDPYSAGRYKFEKIG